MRNFSVQSQCSVSNSSSEAFFLPSETDHRLTFVTLVTGIKPLNQNLSKLSLGLKVTKVPVSPAILVIKVTKVNLSH